MTEIVCIVSGLMYGGGQRVVSDLVAGAKRQGADISVLLLGRRVHQFDHFAPYTIEYDGRYNRVNTLMRTARALREHLVRDRVSLIHTHGLDADLIGWLAIRRTGARQIVHLHVMPDWLRSRKPKHLMRRVWTRRAYSGRGVQMVAVSQAVRKYWAETVPFDERLLHVIHNGVELSAYQAKSERQRDKEGVLVIGAAARLVASKGLHCLLDALGMLASEGVRFSLRVAGNGEQREKLEHQARVLKISEQVEFLNQVSDMPRFFGSIDIFACPSFTEGMPITVLESLAAGKPVIATDVGGIPEVVRDGREGLLVPPNDSRELAKALRRLIKDADLRSRMGTAAECRAREHFSIDSFVMNLTDLYEDVMSKESGRPRV